MLAPNTNAITSQVTSDYGVNNYLMAWAHTLLNTSLYPLDPKPAWFDGVAGELTATKTKTKEWLVQEFPDIAAALPQTLISYANLFIAASEELLGILKDKTSLTNAEKNSVIELIEATLESLNDQKSKVDSVQEQIVTLSNHFTADHEKLVNGKDSAAKAVQLADEERLRIENKIAAPQVELADARQKVTVSGIGIGLGIFLAVAAFALAVATGGTGLIVAGAVGVVGVGVAATFTGIYTAKIGRLMEEIAERQAALEDKKKQITALKGLLQTMDSLRGHNEAAKVALMNISTMWKTLGGKLESVLTDLKAAQGDAIGVAVRRMNLNSARRNWKDTADWAQKIQDLASGTKVQPVLQHRTLVNSF